METQNSENPVDPQELISRLKKLIESIKNKQNSKKDGNELQTSHTPQN